MPNTKEYKDRSGQNRITHRADNGRVTYASSEGYKNVKDMRDTAINSSLELLTHYRKKMNRKQVDELKSLIK
jgi:uncharacterized protein YegP (UPF0339 family)